MNYVTTCALPPLNTGPYGTTGSEQGVVEELTRSDSARMESCASAEQAPNTYWVFVGIREKGIKKRKVSDERPEYAQLYCQNKNNLDVQRF